MRALLGPPLSEITSSHIQVPLHKVRREVQSNSKFHLLVIFCEYFLTSSLIRALLAPKDKVGQDMPI